MIQYAAVKCTSYNILYVTTSTNLIPKRQPTTITQEKPGIYKELIFLSKVHDRF